MTDRELLEASATAMGYEVLPSSRHLPPDAAGVYIRDPIDGVLYWNPLNDSGQAFDLAVVRRLMEGHAGFQCELAVQMNAISDRGAATRRAIVMVVAAESGAP